MASLSVILGSGFSKPAGLPLVKEINSYFERDNAENILKFSSGEFMWIDFANDTYRHNGRIGYDHLAHGILLNEFAKQYVDENKEFTNYEDFYQFVIDNLYNEVKVENLKQKSISSFDEHFPKIKDGQFYKNYVHAIHHFQPREFRSMINHLIGDLLYVRKTKEEIEQLYQCFIVFYKEYDSIDIITLNHDLLLEYLIKNFLNKEYSDGFTKDQKILRSSDGETLNLFQGVFSKVINIIKLHGSIDMYRYAIANEEGSIIKPTGEYLYFKTHDYDEKQKPIRHDPITGEVVQRFHWEIDPQFITGTRKEEIISQPGIYKTLYEESEKRLMECKTLLIIGYSFGDEHVNKLIQKAIEESEVLETIINVNPSLELPFKTKSIETHYLKDIQELTKLKNN